MWFLLRKQRPSSGIDCGTDCTHTYTYGTVVHLAATATSANWYFDGWDGACTVSSNTCTVSMTQDRTVTAYFTFDSCPTCRLSQRQAHHDPRKSARDGVGV